MRYGWEELKIAIQQPHYFLQEINRLCHRRFYTWEYNRKGIDIHGEDWDNLILLDACRPDAYRERVLPEIPEGHFETRESRGGATREWVIGNFTNRQLHDTVYVTGSSWILKIGDEIGADLHAVIDAKDDFDIHQEKQVEKALEANDQFPHKRLLIHLIPPHHPYIGPTAEEHLPSIKDQGNEFFRKVRKDEFDFSDEILWKSYLENLDRVVPAVRTLIDELPGKTIVSADHTELFGSRTYPLPIREWGHINGVYDPELVTVPWHVHDGDRKTIRSDPPVEDEIDSRSEEEIEEHLRALGYKV